MGALAGRVAVVAGASRGIGRGCALELAAAGATVYGLGRTLREGEGSLPGSLETTAREARELGGEMIPVVCDLRSDAELAAAFARVERERGRLDALVNSAFDLPEGCGNGVPFYQTPISYWDDMLGIGARTAYAATWHAAQLMLPRGAGLVANISSQGAREYFVHATYGISKSALDRITRDTGRDLLPTGIAVVSLWPAYVLTERILAFDAEEWGVDLEGAETPRFAGRAVVALASDPDVVKRGGRIFTTRQIAEAYGFRDVDGSLPKGAPDPETWYPAL
ncbi:MAG TPA: SDR family NAD(P)-dependent oxidoreductase [Myxococcota bacterium]|nr:SDR family NAD(P)-dependent oxidoreductase [Myxococcota bacterium]